MPISLKFICTYLVLGSTIVNKCATRFIIKQLCLVPTQYLYLFSVILKTGSDYFPK